MFPAAKPGRKPAVSMRKRLDHLENLVKNAMSGESPEEDQIGSSNSPETIGRSEKSVTQNESHEARDANSRQASDDDDAVREVWDSSGSVVRGSKDAAYVGATHWAAILDDVIPLFIALLLVPAKPL